MSLESASYITKKENTQPNEYKYSSDKIQKGKNNIVVILRAK